MPEFWERKDGMHPAGVFLRGWEQSHAVLRFDLEQESHEVIRHEYFHHLESLDFEALPTWLNDGWARGDRAGADNAAGFVAQWWDAAEGNEAMETWEARVKANPQTGYSGMDGEMGRSRRLKMAK